jgi:hypothetical protein
MIYKNKVILVSFFTIFSIIGFMVKLPRLFHKFDKELHFMFYFFTTVFILLLFRKRRFISFLVISLFGILIEFAQEFSNKITIRIIGKAIHGRFDIEDIRYNMIGVVCGVVFSKIIQLIFKIGK